MPGDYRADAVLTTNDPAQPEIRIPLQLDVVNGVIIAANPLAIDFSAVDQTIPVTENISLTNAGGGILTITQIDLPSTFSSSFVTLPISLTPQQSVPVEITFAPEAAGAVSGDLVIHSNAINEAELAIPLSGYGLPTPSLSLSANRSKLSTPIGWHHDLLPGRRQRSIRVSGCQQCPYFLRCYYS
ncbi:MAG: hypothetical protein ACI957_005618 [Verrucomicrobiales bacterium]